MTDELNSRNTPELDAERVIDNPVDELARIMGYNNDPSPVAGATTEEATTAEDLEAELMREFGIEPLENQSEVSATSNADVFASEQLQTEPEVNLSEVRTEQTTFIREPVEQPIYQPENTSDDVLAEMVQYSVPAQEENVVTNAALPNDTGAQLGGDDFANDLEMELAKLQEGLSVGTSIPEPLEHSDPVMVDQSQEVREPTVTSAFDAPISPDVAEPADEPVVFETENAAVDMSYVIDTENDVEQTTEFDIPSIEPIDVHTVPEETFDVDLDSELEREFSQMFAEENLRTDENGSDVTATDDTNSANEQDIGSFFDMSAMNEPQADGFVEANVAPVLMQPERIDVSQDNTVWHDSQVTPIGGSSNTGKFAAVGLLAFLVLGAGGYIVYNNLASESGGSNEPVVIKADNSSFKEAPADPGGTSVPNQDQAVYNQVEGNDTSVASQPSLVEATEEPVDIVQRTLDPSLLPLEGRNATEKVEDRLVSGSPTDVAVADGGPKPLIIPKKVRTVVVQADGTIITREEPVVTPPEQEDAASDVQTFSNQGVISAQTNEQLANVAEQQEVAAVSDNEPQSNITPSEAETNTQTTPTAPVQAAQPLAETQTATAPVENFSGYYMQIASQPSLAAAQSSYQNLVGRYNSVLGGRGVEYQKAEIAGKGTFHRVRIQVGERSEANSLCSRYKSAGGSCFVTR